MVHYYCISPEYLTSVFSYIPDFAVFPPTLLISKQKQTKAKVKNKIVS